MSLDYSYSELVPGTIENADVEAHQLSIIPTSDQPALEETGAFSSTIWGYAPELLPVVASSTMSIGFLSASILRHELAHKTIEQTASLRAMGLTCIGTTVVFAAVGAWKIKQDKPKDNNR